MSRPSLQFRDAIAEFRSGEALRTVSPNLHANCLFKHTFDGGTEICIVVELQIHISAILETKREAHKVRDGDARRRPWLSFRAEVGRRRAAYDHVFPELSPARERGCRTLCLFGSARARELLPPPVLTNHVAVCVRALRFTT